MKKNIFKRILPVFIVAVLMMALSVQAANEPVIEDFETDLSGWSLTRPDAELDTVSIVNHWSNENEGVLQFKPNQSNSGTLMADRNFAGFTGKVVVDFEVMFTSLGDANILYAMQGNDHLFNITSSGGQIIMYVGKGAYDKTYSLVSLVPANDFKENVPYKFTILLNNDRINAFVNGKHKVVNYPTRVKVTSGLSRFRMSMSNQSTAALMVDNVKIYNAGDETAMLKGAKILKAPYIDKTISVDYSFAEGYENANAAVNWMKSDTEDGTYSYVSGISNSKNYKPSQDDMGKWLKAEIIPVSADGIVGAPVYTAPVQDKSVKSETELSGSNGWAGATVSDDVLTYASQMSKTPAAPVSGKTIIEFEVSMSVKQAANVYVYQDSSYAFTMSFTDTALQIATGTEKNSGYKPAVVLSSYDVNTWYKVKAVMNPAATSSSDASYIDFYINDKPVILNAFFRSDITTKGITKVMFNSAGKGGTSVRNFSVYKVAQPSEKLLISDFAVVDSEGATVESISADMTASLKADVSLLDGNRNVMLVLAYYNKDGIADVEFVDAMLTDGDIITLATKPLEVKYTAGETVVKGFIWDRDTLTPIEQNIEF